MTNDLVLLLLPAALPVLCNLWTCFRLRAEWPTSVAMMADDTARHLDSHWPIMEQRR